MLDLSSVAVPALCANDADDLPAPWRFYALSCVDTTVTLVTPRLGEGGQTTFPATRATPATPS